MLNVLKSCFIGCAIYLFEFYRDFSLLDGLITLMFQKNDVKLKALKKPADFTQQA